jgi:hypothetical protein
MKKLPNIEQKRSKAGAGDAGMAFRLQVEHYWPGAPDLVRSPRSWPSQ